MTDQQKTVATFHLHDIVLETGDDKEWTITEFSEGMVIIEDDEIYHAVTPSRLTLVYRPPTREETSSLRSRVAELEYALMPFAGSALSGKAYEAARKAMGVES